MGLFNKIKNMFKDTKNEEEKQEHITKEELEQEPKTEIVEEDNSKIKKKVSEQTKKESIDKKNVKIYEKGLTKTRQGFVSKLADLTSKYSKVNEEYFEELEEILIMADIGVNTVMDFMDRLKDRVRKEKIENPEILKELIVDELFIIYVNDQVLTSKINYAKKDQLLSYS